MGNDAESRIIEGLPGMNQVRELAHTADIGFEVRGTDLDRLFELAAGGLAVAIGAEAAGAAEPAPERPTGTSGSARAGRSPERPEAHDEEIRLTRPDLERLLVAWLGELLYRSTTSRAVPRHVRARVSERDGAFVLQARIGWAPWDREGPSREIKGVTYHGLQVEERDGAWHARVVLDV